jgi:hypothetical protein
VLPAGRGDRGGRVAVSNERSLKGRGAPRAPRSGPPRPLGGRLGSIESDEPGSTLPNRPDVPGSSRPGVPGVGVGTCHVCGARTDRARHPVERLASGPSGVGLRDRLRPRFARWRVEVSTMTQRT